MESQTPPGSEYFRVKIDIVIRIAGVTIQIDSVQHTYTCRNIPREIGSPFSIEIAVFNNRICVRLEIYQRFRAAIKEPEELLYLFICIAIGLGLGAAQSVITVIAFFIIILVIILRKMFVRSREETQNLHLTVSSHNPGKIELGQIVRILNDHCSAVDIKRFDETREMLEASFLVEFSDFSQLEKAKNELNQLSDSVKVTFLDLQRTY